MNNILQNFLILEGIGNSILPGLGAVPGLVYLACVSAKPAAKGIGRGATATGKLAKSALRQRERIASPATPEAKPQAPPQPTEEERIRKADEWLAAEKKRIAESALGEIRTRGEINKAERRYTLAIKQIQSGSGKLSP